MRAQIKFLGGVAENNLTGSCFLLTVEQGKKTLRVLIDAGLVQGGFTDSLEKNQAILKNFRPSDIDHIILTHSHIDHVGRLPLFTKAGFSGRIICTSGTRNLLRTMLEDSAKIQMAEAGYLTTRAQKEAARNQSHDFSRQKLTRGNYDRVKNQAKKDKQNRDQRYQPLYTIDDVETVDSLVKNGGFDYLEWVRLSHGVKVKFYPSGHVMGGAIVVIRIDADPKPIYLCATGDLGRKDGIILPPPERIKEPVDAMILESTYGGRSHPARDEEIEKLLGLIRKAHQRKQRIIIPSFALERSQEIIYLLSYHMERNDIPRIPIFLDSPLGMKITSVFASGWEAGMFSDQQKLAFNPFDPADNPNFRIVTTQEESDGLIARTGCYIVIAGSGMCDAGRVRGHLRANLGKTDTVVCLIGYMAENSLGRKLKDGHHSVRMNKEEITVNAKVVSFDSFSAHADGPFLAEYARSVLGRNRLAAKKVFLVHGSESSAAELRTDLEDIMTAKLRDRVSIMIPKINQSIQIY